MKKYSIDDFGVKDQNKTIENNNQEITTLKRRVKRLEEKFYSITQDYWILVEKLNENFQVLEERIKKRR